METWLKMQKLLSSEWVQKNGILFALYDENAFCRLWNKSSHSVDMQDSSYVEATHYMDEGEFIDKMPTDLTGWTEITGENPTIEGTEFFRETDTLQWYHYVPYYKSEIRNPVMYHISTVRYVGGNHYTGASKEEEEDFAEDYLPQLQEMMREYTGNFILNFRQIDNQLYGVCRVYGENKFLNTCTQNLLYSFTLEYDEETDSLVKLEEFDGKEVIYYDQDWIVYYTLEGLFYMDTDTRTEHLVHKREKDSPSDETYLNFCVGIKNDYIMYEIGDDVFFIKMRKEK